MARIYVDFGGLQELQNKMSRILNEANDLENEITRSANRLDWEVSQKRSINEQIHGARRKAARLAQKAEQMQRFLVRANAEFNRTDLKCAKEQQKVTYNLESVWKNFLGFYSRTFSEIGQCGVEVLEALKNAGYYFLNGVIDFKKAHLGAINTAIGLGSVGVAPIAPFVVSGALRERIGAVCGGGSSGKGETRLKYPKSNNNLDDSIVNYLLDTVSPIPIKLNSGNSTLNNGVSVINDISPSLKTKNIEPAIDWNTGKFNPAKLKPSPLELYKMWFKFMGVYIDESGYHFPGEIRFTPEC